ncbi:hypothetical protein BDV38DRAFT_252619, partial [Aspergillus pseudotamarii]
MGTDSYSMYNPSQPCVTDNIVGFKVSSGFLIISFILHTSCLPIYLRLAFQHSSGMASRVPP